MKNVNSSFTYSIDRPSSWANESTAWLWGYWSFGWADSIVKVRGTARVSARALGCLFPNGPPPSSQVDNIDVASKTFAIDPKTPPTYGFKPKARWLAFNLMSELDAPGE